MNVLLIEDNPADARYVGLCLDPDSFHLSCTSRMGEALPMLANNHFDIVLTDLSLPDCHGLESLRKLLLAGVELPIIVMTGLNDENTALQALQDGAQDYIVKEHNNEVLLPRALRYARERHQISQALNIEKERHLRASRNFQTLFDGIPDSLVLLDVTLNILYANRGAEGLFGEQGITANIVGRSCNDIFCKLKVPCPDCLVKKCIASGKTEQNKTTLDDGRVIALRTFPLKNSSGNVEQVIKMASDITDSERLRSEAVRTGQLAALGEMAAGVAHEINNPINGVINYATILAQKISDESLGDIANRIVHEGDRIAGIVSKLLSFSRERVEPLKPFSLIEVFESSLILLQNHLQKDGIRLQTNVPNDLPLAMGRPHQIEQVIVNLISNARYALNSRFPGPDDHKQLAISATASDTEFLDMCFLDYGCGIPEAIQNKIFSPFFSTKPSSHGTGLGLSISLGIMQDHGGSLTVNSVENEFTEFRLQLPRAPGLY